MKTDDSFQNLNKAELQSVDGGFTIVRLFERVAAILAELLTVKPTT